MACRTYEPGEVSTLGETIYRERIQSSVEPAKRGSFVVIDIESGDYEVGTSDAAATRRLLNRRPDSVTYGIRVGHQASYSHVGRFRASQEDD